MSAHMRRTMGRLGACGIMVAVVLALACALAGGRTLAYAVEADEAAGNGQDAPLGEAGGDPGQEPAEGEDGAAESGGSDEFADLTTETLGKDFESTKQPDDAEADAKEEAEDLGKNLVDPTQRADNSFIYDTSIGAIAGQSSLYDKRIVQVEGEVIGDRIAEGPGYYWIELSSSDEDDAASISVLISEDQTAQIDRYGRYGVTGTTFQVRGTYHQACDEHEGLSDIHATNSAVVAPGVDHPDEFDIGAFLPGVLTIIVGVILLLVFRFARERMR